MDLQRCAGSSGHIAAERGCCPLTVGRSGRGTHREPAELGIVRVASRTQHRMSLEHRDEHLPADVGERGREEHRRRKRE